jgi:hypothetical protein
MYIRLGQQPRRGDSGICGVNQSIMGPVATII